MNSIKNLLVFALFLLPVLSSGQDQSTKTVNKGLTVSIQDRELGIMVPFYLSNKFILAPGFQFVSASKVGTDIGLGLLTKAFLNDHKSIRPYWGLRAGLGFYNAPNTSNQIDIILGAAFGVEYFFNPNFSIGIEPQLNLTKSDDESDRFGNPGGTGVNTATSLTANIYF